MIFKHHLQPPEGDFTFVLDTRRRFNVCATRPRRQQQLRTSRDRLNSVDDFVNMIGTYNTLMNSSEIKNLTVLNVLLEFLNFRYNWNFGSSEKHILDHVRYFLEMRIVAWQKR